MDFVAASPILRPPLGDEEVGGGGTDEESSMASELLERLVVGVITCVFAIVGALIGAVTGALIGLATETGFFRGAGIGAISGAVFSIEAVESSVALWHSSDSGLRSILYVVDIIYSLLSGRIVREKVGPAVQSAVQSQMSALDLPYVEALDIFETGGTCGMSKDSVDSLPKIRVTLENSLDGSGERICCSVCLQDIHIGETVRSLPNCQHMFHLPCIDGWLTRHGSCPLCRREI
ncbi:NEP1-interacting protein 1 [Apostasia shenzhenica]|uniref:NEP1-interacting protein 1 n=1 Tax=Apostasia shenzhenica TaxID=1088818 RepID=A0A2I0AVP0_9ASPA|nr:NEP1-interacting protein 1 [Apostasia shenzhenica]